VLRATASLPFHVRLNPFSTIVAVHSASITGVALLIFTAALPDFSRSAKVIAFGASGPESPKA